MWGVATWDDKERYRPDPWTNEDFYKLGISDWQDFIAQWRVYGVCNHSCIEIGCGAGRITMHMAKFFKSFQAIDVSEGMLAYARKHIKDPKILFFLVDGINLPIADKSLTAAFSTHVFQHFDSLSYASEYFQEISRVLTSGGTIMIHVPIVDWSSIPRPFTKLLQARESLNQFETWIRRKMIVRGLSIPIMRKISYPINYIYSILPQYNFTDIQILIFTTKSNNFPHPFVFARKF